VSKTTPRRAACEQAVFPLDSDAAEACATFMQLLRGPDALGTTVQEWRTTTGSALADMLQVRSAMRCQETHSVSQVIIHEKYMPLTVPMSPAM